MYIKFFTLEEGEKSMLRRIKNNQYQLIQSNKLKNLMQILTLYKVCVGMGCPKRISIAIYNPVKRVLEVFCQHYLRSDLQVFFFIILNHGL